MCTPKKTNDKKKIRKVRGQNPEKETLNLAESQSEPKEHYFHK